ncbi:Cullin-5 [Entamoeba marina]
MNTTKSNPLDNYLPLIRKIYLGVDPPSLMDIAIVHSKFKNNMSQHTFHTNLYLLLKNYFSSLIPVILVDPTPASRLHLIFTNHKVRRHSLYTAISVFPGDHRKIIKTAFIEFIDSLVRRGIIDLLIHEISISRGEIMCIEVMAGIKRFVLLLIKETREKSLEKFKTSLIQTSQKDYKRISKKLRTNVEQYIKQIQIIITNDTTMEKVMFPEFLQEKLEDIRNEELVMNASTYLVDEVSGLLNEKRYDLLVLLVDIFERNGILNYFESPLKVFLVEKTKSFLQLDLMYTFKQLRNLGEEIKENIQNKILEESINNYIKQCFSLMGDLVLESLINKQINSYLCSHQVNENIKEIQIFTHSVVYYPSKDAFLIIYNKYLMTRLLEGLSILEDEIIVINQIISHYKCPQSLQIKKNLQEIINCMEISNSLAYSFKMSTIVLPRTSFSKPLLLTIQNPFFDIFNEFKIQYTNTHYKRIVDLCFSEGRMELVYRPTNITISSPPLFALLLYLFNTFDTITIANLLKYFEIENEELIMSHINELKKRNMFHIKNDVISVVNILEDITLEPPKLDQVSKKELNEQQSDVQKKRLSVVSAAMTRIMKSSKQLTQEILFNETISKIKQFVPSKKLMTESLDYLIENEYIEVDTKDDHLLIYIV